MRRQLAQYDAMIDLLVDLLVRECIESEGHEKPATSWQGSTMRRTKWPEAEPEHIVRGVTAS